MRNYKIAYGNNRFDKKWKNTEISWDDFCSRVKTTQRTSETIAEYEKLNRASRDAIKDIGGFVGGHISGGRRKKGNILSRSILALDMDYGRIGIWEEIKALFPYKCLIYSTHSHTKDRPRLRLIIPLSRDVKSEEYSAVSRMVAKEIDIELFDDTTYEPERLMYWPSTSKDGDFVYEENGGEVLNPDDFLNLYDDWQDASTWPVSSRRSEIIKRSIKKQEDPLLKTGLVGAFCRAYNVSSAIDRFLDTVYERSVIQGRYNYIPADSSAGLVLYDDKFAYSHHATDPASSRLVNAFDLVRIHKFGDLDDGALSLNRKSTIPSFTAMCEFAAKDENVKAIVLKEKIKGVGDDFKAPDWMKALDIDKSGKIRDSLSNIVLITRHDDNLLSIAFNKHKDTIDVRDSLPWDQVKNGWSDSDNAALKVYIAEKYGIYSPAKTKDAVLAVAAERAYHPIKMYLDNLSRWDNVKRVDTLLIDYFGASDCAYTRAVTRKTLVAAVSRIYKPGSKFDSVLILNGPQGIGKSTFFSKLAGEWFSDSLSLTDMKDKSGAEKLQGYWILELGELAGMKKADVEVVKSFVSRFDDKYRASYGINVESHPRQCIIVGSTNSEIGFLRDITGNRRFWPVKITGDGNKKAWQMTKEDVDMIWAESLEIYKNNESLYLEGDEAVQAVYEQDDAMESDEREGLVRKYLDRLLPENWEDMSLYERRNFLNDNDFGNSEKTGSIKRDLVCNMEIWCECFLKDASSLRSIDSYQIAAIMKKIDSWQRYKGNKKGVLKIPIYGEQRLYERKK